MKKEKAKKYLKLAGNILTILALVLIIHRLIHYDIDYSMLLSGSNLLILMGLALAFAVHLIILSLSWNTILHCLGYKQVQFRDTQTVFCKSNLMKYIPGNVMQYVGRNEIAVRYDLNHARVAFSTILDILANVIGVGIVGVICYGKGLGIIYEKYHDRLPFVLLIGAVFLAALLVAALIFRKRIKEKMQGIDLKKYVLCILLYAVFAVYSAAILVIIMLHILHLSLTGNTIPIVMGAYLLSWLLGFLMPGVPGGVGIRETATTLLLSSFIQEDAVLLAIVIYRFVNVLGDLLAYLLCVIRNFCRFQNSKRNAH